MAKLVRRRASAIFRVLFPDLPDWPPSPRAALRAFSSAQTFRVEELMRDGHYLIRAELPGLDPDKDIEVTVGGKTLTIYAERGQQDEEPQRTEFRYGPRARSVRLPARVDAHDVRARYRNGILEISVPVPEAQREGSGSRSRTKTSRNQRKQRHQPRDPRPHRGCPGPRSRPLLHRFHRPHNNRKQGSKALWQAQKPIVIAENPSGLFTAWLSGITRWLRSHAAA